jgi:hypothetical protein
MEFTMNKESKTYVVGSHSFADAQEMAKKAADLGVKPERVEHEVLPELAALEALPPVEMRDADRQFIYIGQDPEEWDNWLMSKHAEAYTKRRDKKALEIGREALWNKPIDTPVTPDQVTKQDAGKPRWSQLLAHMPLALAECVKVREYGVEKYRAIAEKAGASFDPEGWKTNTPDRYLESAQRHIIALYRGERENPEDGNVQHAAQAIVDLLFFLELELNGRP